MYTYKTFVVDGSFVLMRPIFMTLLVFAIVVLLMILLPMTYRRFMNAFVVLALSLLSMIVSSQLLFFEGIIVDEVGLGGDGFQTILFLLLNCLNVLNIFLYFMIRKKKRAQAKDAAA